MITHPVSYIKIVGEFFITKRRQGGVLSPREWVLLREWERQGISRRAAVAGIEAAFDQLLLSTKGRAVSLKYCERFARQAAEEEELG